MAAVAWSDGGMTPWHMWGSNQEIELSGAFAAQSTFVSSQMLQVHYGRPESWRFWFEFDVHEVTGTVDPGATVQVFFQATFGVGRTTTRLESFCTLECTGPANIQPGVIRCCSSVEFPAENSARVSPNIVDHFVAETIQITANSRLVEADASLVVRGSVLAFVAPDVHLRPEWHIHQFPGGETKGK
jgi:hypothetical protein